METFSFGRVEVEAQDLLWEAGGLSLEVKTALLLLAGFAANGGWGLWNGSLHSALQ